MTTTVAVTEKLAGIMQGILQTRWSVETDDTDALGSLQDTYSAEWDAVKGGRYMLAVSTVRDSEAALVSATWVADVDDETGGYYTRQLIESEDAEDLEVGKRMACTAIVQDLLERLQIAWESGEYSDSCSGGQHQAVLVAWSDIERLLGRPHEGYADDDLTTVIALIASGAPGWVADAEGFGDETFWGLIGPQIGDDDDASPDEDTSLRATLVAALNAYEGDNAWEDVIRESSLFDTDREDEIPASADAVPVVGGGWIVYRHEAGCWEYDATWTPQE